MNKIINSSIVIVGLGSFLLMSLYGLGLIFGGNTSSDKKFGIIFTIILFSIPVAVTSYRYFSEGRFKRKSTNHTWYGGKLDTFLGSEILKLRHDTEKLLEQESIYDIHLSDYSFVILPVAKAFEGFLKKLLLYLHLVQKSDLKSDPYVAINQYFNPNDNLTHKYLKDKKRDKAVPVLIYAVYQECRNNILHYDLHRNTLVKSHGDAQFLVQRIEDAIIKAYVAYVRGAKQKIVETVI